MKKLLSLVIVFFISTNLFSQIDSTKVAFVSYWSIGDSYDYKIIKIRQQWKEDKLTKDLKQEYIANFTVLDSTKNSYTIKWSYKIDLKNAYKIPEKFLDRFSKYDIIEIKYKTSEVGNFLEVLNWKEVGETMNSMFDDMIELLSENDKKKEDYLKQSLQSIKQTYSSKEGIEQLAVNELKYLHFPMGLEYDITKPLIYDDELPNMFGGEPIKAKAKLYFVDVDFEENFCIIKQEVSLNPEDTKAFLYQFIKQMKPDTKEVNEAFKTAVYEINDNNTYEFYYYPGIPHRIETTRETIIDINNEKVKQIEKTIIELIYNQ